MSNDARYAVYLLLGGGPVEPAVRTAALDRMQAADLREAADLIGTLPEDWECDPGRGDAAEHLRRKADELEEFARRVEPTPHRGGEAG